MNHAMDHQVLSERIKDLFQVAFVLKMRLFGKIYLEGRAVHRQLLGNGCWTVDACLAQLNSKKQTSCNAHPISKLKPQRSLQ